MVRIERERFLGNIDDSTWFVVKKVVVNVWMLLKMN